MGRPSGPGPQPLDPRPGPAAPPPASPEQCPSQVIDRHVDHLQKDSQHHSHSHSHGHGHGQGNSGDHDEPIASQAASAFRWSIALNAGLTAMQLAIGFGFGSLALIGDALHNLGDVVGLVLGWGADRLSRRPPRGRFTYGFGRGTQMASLINGLLIFAAGAVVVFEAIQRLRNPLPLVAAPVAWAAAAGIAINLLSARLFGHDHHHDLNQRAAVLHLLTDAAVSVAVLVSALLVGATGWFWLDALTAIGVGAAVIWSALGLLREALALNLDAAPSHVDLARVEQALASLPAVQTVEELHVWGLSTSRIALTAHLRINPLRLRQQALSSDQLLDLAQERLAALGIRKSTLQLETATADQPTRSQPTGSQATRSHDGAALHAQGCSTDANDQPPDGSGHGAPSANLDDVVISQSQP